MKKYAIDGLFLTQKSTGTQRYSYEILNELDKLVQDMDIIIVVPESYKGILNYKNIKLVKYGRLKGIPWEQIDFARYLLVSERMGLFFNNIVTVFVPRGIIAIHDVCYKARPKFYSSVRDKVSMMWHRLNYWVACRSKMKIVTVSEFSKSEIVKWYKIKPDRVTVAYSSWQHIEQIRENEKVFVANPKLEKGKYYFTLSTLGANKNFRWILHAAKNNPDNMFAIAGGGKLKGAAEAAGFVDLPNVLFLGYISDGEIKSLMRHCKGFLFPTLYEGFGLTPLEAAACGAKSIAVSDTPCMNEIYGENVEYINPHEMGTQLARIAGHLNRDELLGRYSWKKSAKIWKKVMIM